MKKHRIRLYHEQKSVSTYQQVYKCKIFLIGLIETISSLDPYNVLTGVLSHIKV